MKEKRMVIGSKWYSFPNEQGIVQEGVTITSCSLTQNISDEKVSGYSVFTDSFKGLAVLQNIKKVPGIYEFTLSLESQKGKAVVKVADITYTGDVEIKEIPLAGK